MQRAEVGAKVNLSLAVTGKRGGMHTLDMRVCEVSLCDAVEIAEGKGDRFEWIAEPYGFKRDLFLPRLEKIYAAVTDCFGIFPRFRIEKNIPSGAGLGGSSALAAAMTIVCERVTGRKAEEDFLLSLGSDVPYMYRGGEARVTGCGEQVETMPYVEREVLIAFPEGGVDTAAAYALYDAMSRHDAEGGNRGKYFNDLYLPATTLNPEIARVKEVLLRCGAENVVMTGSGSAVCAFFDEADGIKAQEAYGRVKKEVRATLVRTVKRNRSFQTG